MVVNMIIKWVTSDLGSGHSRNTRALCDCKLTGVKVDMDLNDSLTANPGDHL